MMEVSAEEEEHIFESINRFNYLYAADVDQYEMEVEIKTRPTMGNKGTGMRLKLLTNILRKAKVLRQTLYAFETWTEK